MQGYSRIIANIIISGFCLILFSCTPGTCFEDTESYIKASFYSMKTGKPDPPDSLVVYGYGNEEQKVYNNLKKIQPALLPVDASSASSVFVIRLNKLTDTLTLLHNSYIHLISKECGYIFFHNLDTVYSTRHTIDSVAVTNSKITNITNEENIRIYY